jgi:integrase
MAYVEKRGPRKYRARYRDPNNDERSRTFETRRDAERFLTSIEHTKNVGGYIDPAAGNRTFGNYVAAWLAIQVFRDSTRERVESNVRVHMVPMFGGRRLGGIRPSDIQAFVRKMSETHAPNTVKVVYRQLAAILRAAVSDGLIASTPCRGVKLPRITRAQVVPMEREQVVALIAHAPDHFKALILTGAGSGLRQGEILGLTVNRIDFLRRTIRVDRQLVTLQGEDPKLAPPKTEASMRTVPVPQLVLDALADHLSRFPAKGDELVFTNSHGGAWRRRVFLLAFANTVKRAGLAKDITCHDLRHFYASLLIHKGHSVKTVSARLGHANAVETLNTYAHLWPESDDATREAVEDVLGNNSRPGRGLGSEKAASSQVTDGSSQFFSMWVVGDKKPA